jgi:hypothetical protein
MINVEAASDIKTATSFKAVKITLIEAPVPLPVSAVPNPVVNTPPPTSP